MKYRLAVISLFAAACGSPAKTPVSNVPSVSSTIALTSDDKALWVVNADSDSVSVLDPQARTLSDEIALAAAPPALDPTTMRYEPSIKPRALAILPGDKKVYVAGQTANKVYVLDAATHKVTGSIAVGAAPVGVVAAPDGSAIYVVSHEAASITKIDPASDKIVGTLSIADHPWGASISADGKSLYVTHLLLHAGVTVIDTASFKVRNSVELKDQPADVANGKLVPNGVARGVYSAVPRPVGGELWIAHMLLATGTPQPDLDFESTAFPTITLLDAGATAEAKRLLFKPLMVPTATGAFNDVISGPRALAFTPDGKLALLANSGSEDVMVFDGVTGNERVLVRPLPTTFIEGVVVDHAGLHAYVDGRNSHNVAVITIAEANVSSPAAVDGNAIERLKNDPMPAQLRLGQRLFYTANTAAYPTTKNFWISCSTCHLEGGTDAVTWQFAQGPRDTPSNAGGESHTGFLFRQALRNDVVQYDKTIRVEQGGSFDRTNAGQLTLLQALSAFVNQAIPFPQNPYLAADGTLTASQGRGQTLFADNCATCHSGDYYTDSGSGNPTLDLAGSIVLHDIGTCVVSGQYVDKPEPDDIDGIMHTACDFDTPSLRSVFATPPYFHDGSAATLADAVDRIPSASLLSTQDKSDLVAYLQTL